MTGHMDKDMDKPKERQMPSFLLTLVQSEIYELGDPIKYYATYILKKIVSGKIFNECSHFVLSTYSL